MVYHRPRIARRPAAQLRFKFVRSRRRPDGEEGVELDNYHEPIRCTAALRQADVAWFTGIFNNTFIIARRTHESSNRECTFNALMQRYNYFLTTNVVYSYT